MKNFILFLSLMASFAAADIIKCSDKNPFYFKFLPTDVATLKPGQSTNVEGRCFANISIKVVETDDAFIAQLFVKDKASYLCSEFVLLTSGKTPKASLPFLTGSYNVTYDKSTMSDGEIAHVRRRGLRMLLSCEDLSAWPKSLFMTLKLYLGGMGLNPHIPIFGSKVPEYQLKANIDWIAGATGYQYQRLPANYLLTIDKSQIKSGTTLLIYRFDGIDNMIHVGSGSRAGHTAIAVWNNGELHVMESQDAAYWPRKGIQDNKWDDWMRWAHNADYNVVILPLKPEYQAIFDEEKAWAWYQHLSGLDYGFHNFLYAWLDAPNKNVPYFFNLEVLSSLIDVYQLIRPQDVKLIFLEAFNLRLGISATNIGEVWEELYNRDMSFDDLVSIVEKEGWQYSDGVNYVCSSFVASVHRRAGLFGDLDINSTEFTPRDVYTMDFFDNSGNNIPKECGDHAKFGICQVMGKVQMELDNVGTVKPYAHMNESCPTSAPDYERTSGC